MENIRENISLVDIGRGDAIAQFNDSLVEALEDCRNPNKRANAPRTITLTVKMIPNEKRSAVKVFAATKVSLAAPEPSESQVFISGKPGEVQSGLAPINQQRFDFTENDVDS